MTQRFFALKKHVYSFALQGFAERRLKMKNQPLLLIMAGVNLPINVFLRWCCSTDHKDIGTMYFIFGGVSSLLGTWLSVIMAGV